MMYQISTYRGTLKGWQHVGKPRPAADAARLLALLQRVRPDWNSKIYSNRI